MFRSRIGLTLLLVLVFAMNYVDGSGTALWDGSRRSLRNGISLRLCDAGVERQCPRGLPNHDATDRLAVWLFRCVFLSFRRFA
jgi:hypothetical protein